MREQLLLPRLILLYLWCGTMTVTFVWLVYPQAWISWDGETLLFWSIVLVGPLSIVLLSAVLVLLRNPALRLAKRLLGFECLLLLFVGAAMLVTPGYRMTGLAAISAFFVAVPGLLLFPSQTAPELARPSLSGVVFSGLVTLMIVLNWSASNAAHVTDSAVRAARGEPFCLAVAADGLGRYKTVTKHSELTGLEMRTPFTSGGGSDDFQFAYHAILVVDPGLVFNWSYWKGGFDLLEAVRPPCEPVADFLATLE